MEGSRDLRHTGSSQLLYEASIAFHLYGIDYNKIEFLTLTLIDGVNEVIWPLSCIRNAKKYVCFSKLLTKFFKRLDKTVWTSELEPPFGTECLKAR